MFTKFLCFLFAITLALASAAAETPGAEPLTAGELDALLSSVKEEALAGSPMNDPAAESAQNEDGNLFRYENVRIYAEGTELAADTPVNALVFEDSEGAVFRGTGIDTQTADLLEAYPLDNPELAGARDEALLYLRDTAYSGFVYGKILRDGQRITTAEYGEVLPDGEGFRRASVTYTLTRGLVTSIRTEGLNSAAPRMDAAGAEEMHEALRELGSRDEYRAVKTSRNGLELTPFGKEDLIFDGFSYTALRPATLPGNPETELIDNEDGTWLLCCKGDGYEAVFLSDAAGEKTDVLSFTLLDDQTEGPRCVRIGDLFSDDFCRFRNGENEMDEQMTELLYGTEGTAPWGQAVYDPADTSLRYVTEADGAEVELLLRYENNILTEIILHTL